VAILLFGLLLTLWGLGGIAGVRMALGMGTVLGLPIMLLGKNKLFILSAAIVGAVVGTILGLCFLDIDIECLNDPEAKTPYEVKFLFWWVVVGTLLGPFLGMLGSRLTKCSA
jgi:hypothetical protein